MSIKSRRIIAMLLCLVMVITSMPMSALAVDVDTTTQVVEQDMPSVEVSPEDVTADIEEETTTEDNPTADVDNPAVVEEETAVEETPAVEEEETPAVDEGTPFVVMKAAAEDETPTAIGTVYLSISYDGEYVDGADGAPVAYVPVSLSDLQEIDLADYGLTEYDYNGQLTALHLYIYAHENIMGENWDDVTVQGGAGSIFFAGGLFGFADCNLQYYCNGEYPEVDGWGVTADQLVLEDGNFYDIAAYTSWSFYSDSNFGFHYFLDDSDEIIHEYTATAGEALTVTLGRGASYMGSGYSMTKVADYTVSYGAEVGAADDTVTTNADGQAEITFDEAGTYYLWVDGGYGAENPLDIVSAPGYAEVTVEEGEEPSCETHDWKDATCSAPKTCGVCGATEGEKNPDAHKYTDGKCEYCGEAEPFINPFTATADGEAVEIAGSGETEDVCTYGPTYKLSVTVPAGTDELVVNCPDGGWGFYEDHSSSNRVSSLPATVQMDDGHTLMCLFVNGEWYHIYIYEAECQHSYVDGACEFCGKSEIEPTHIIKAGTGWSSIDWPYAGCNINRVTVTNVKVDEFTQNGSNYYITLDSAVADDAAVELGIGTNLQYSNLWVLVDDQCITESPITASTDLTTTVQLVDGAATVKIGGCPGYNTGSYIQSYAVNKTFYFSNSGQFPIAPMLSGGSSTSALRVEDDTWTADLSTLFKNISDKEVTYKVAIDGAEAVECAADYTYTCDTPGTRKLVFTAVNDYGTSPNYTATISVLPAEAVKETNYEVQGGTITWFAFTDDQLNALPEGTTYEWDAETTTWTITQPSDINVTGKVITYYNLEKDDPTAKLPLLSGSNAVAGAGTMWDGAVRNQQTNTLSNGAVSTYVYLFEKTPTSNAADQYTVIRFNYDREKPETYFEYKVDGNAELTIVGDVGGVNDHQWTGDREVHVALNAETPADAIISCVEKNNSVTLSNGAGQFSYKTGNWWEEKTWYVKYKIDQFPVLIDSEKTSEEVTVPALSTYTVDLAQLFSDADEADTLTYQVKLNDGAWTNIEGSEYSYTPETAQDYVLTFRAYDGFVYAKDTYTVNMTATNSTENYGIVVIAPDDVKFYCTTGFDAEGKDLLGEEIAVTTFENSQIQILNVPKNVSRISWRDAEGAGMSAPVEVNNSIVLVEASFKAMAGETVDTGTLTVKYGDYTAVGVDNNYLLMDADNYTYVVAPADANYRTYNEGEKTPVAGENVIDLTLKHITVIAPAGSTVSSGRFYSYFRYDFNEPQQTITLDDGRISVDFPVPGSESFIRVQHPDGVTYWDFGDLSDGTTREVTEDMLFIGSDEFTKETVYDNYQKNSHDIADLYLTVNAQGWLDMASGDVHSLNVFRNWIPVANSISNNGVSLPDVTYTVVDINGEPSDGVVTVTPDKYNSCYADIEAVGAGTAIILVSYDAVYNADGEGGKQFSAVWPENTGVIVVTVDAEEAGIATNMTVNEAANAGGKQILDVEHDILFYVGDEGAEYSFTPEEGCTVTVARSTVDDEMTFNGFTDENVTVADDGTVTVSALTTGTHIIKVEKDGKAAYQVIRAREVEYKLTHSDGTEVTAANPAKAGEAITVQFSKLIAPLGKLSGVYNANFGFYYNGEDGAAYRVASGYAYGDYYFGSNAVRQKFTATVPAEWDGDTYTLTDGAIKLGGFGGSFGAHRSTSYMVGKDVNTNASGTAGQASVLPDVVIPTGTPAYTVTLPTETVGYTVTAAEGSTSPVAEGGNYSFTVTISEGYEAGEQFAVKANDVTLTAVEDVYTIENITADQTVTVEGVVEKVVEPALTWQEIMAKTKAYLTAQGEEKAPVVGSTNGEWLVLGLARNGAEADFFEEYYNNVVAYVTENIDAETGRLHNVKSTDNARVILALTALGKDVTNVGGHNLLQAFSDTDYVPKQGINGPVWALIALDSHDYEIPANADSTRQITREWLIEYILSKELADGGWAIGGQVPDDMTPMAVQALAPYYNSNAEVKAAVDKALTVMTTMTATPETYAQMIVALSALGIDCETDERFASVLDNMLTFALENGSFQKGMGSGANQMSTEQAFYAMVAYDRFLDDKTSLYDMTDVNIEAGETPSAVITLDKTAASVKVGKTLTLTAAVSDEIEDKTVTWTSSNEAVATVENGVITAKSEGTATITATVGDFSAACVVTVTKSSGGGSGSGGSSSGLDFGLSEDEIEGYVYVSFEDKGKRRSSELDDIEPKFQSQLGTIISRTKVPFVEGDTIATVTLRLLEAKDMTYSNTGTIEDNFYLAAIGNFTVKGIEYDSFGEFDAGQDSGWMITWNDWFIDQSTSAFEVKNNDVIKWKYTCQLGADIGDDYYEGTGGAGGGGSAASGEDRAAAKDVNNLIEAIGTVDKNSKEAIIAAREAYDKLTEEQKELVSKYDELLAAEKAYAELTGEVIAPTDMPYTDTEGHWAANAIKFVYDKGLMKGESETIFAPNKTASRAMIATILYRLAGSPAVEGQASFGDVADGAWYADAVRWAELNKVVGGYADGNFGPNDNITREQLASILYRYAAANGENMNATADLSSFADANGISEWARTALAWANAEGLITGKTGNIIDAKGYATRAEIAAILMRYLENIAK